MHLQYTLYRLQNYKINSDYVNMFNALYVSIGSVIGIGLYLLTYIGYRNVG